MKCSCGPCPVHGGVAAPPVKPLDIDLLASYMTNDERLWVAERTGWPEVNDTTCTWCQERYAWPGQKRYCIEPDESLLTQRYECPNPWCLADTGLWGERDD